MGEAPFTRGVGAGRRLRRVKRRGVLVIALPVAERTTPAQISLVPIGIGRGERVGSLGHPVQPSSTVEHVQRAHHEAFNVESASP
jgi:hypothetical protein